MLQEGCCKDCMAAWLSMADHLEIKAAMTEEEYWGLSGFGLGQQSYESNGLVAPATAGLEGQDHQSATSRLEKFWGSSFLTPAGCMESCPRIGPCTTARLPVPRQRGHEDGGDG